MEVSKDHILRKKEQEQKKGNKVLKLSQFLYELQHSGRVWLKQFNEKLKLVSLKLHSAITTINEFIVDDLMVAGNDKKKLKQLKANLKKFKI